jgi:Uma2 family endonuclease
MLDYVTEDERRKNKKPATYQDVIDAPEHMVAEILDDELFLSPRPAPRHAVATIRLAAIVLPPLDEGMGGQGGWIILIEPELHRGSDVLVPDLAGWRKERMPRLPKEAFFPTAPDWVCEVLSPSTAEIDRTRKRRIYAREGVSHMWLIDPVVRSLEVSRLESGRWVEVAVHQYDEIVRAEPFEAVAIELSRLWADVESTSNGQDA